MPRFYLHVDGVEERPPVDLPGIAEAKCEAARYAGELICDPASEFWDTGEFRITISDENGLMLFLLQFSGIEAPAIRLSG